MLYCVFLKWFFSQIKWILLKQRLSKNSFKIFLLTWSSNRNHDKLLQSKHTFPLKPLLLKGSLQKTINTVTIGELITTLDFENWFSNRFYSKQYSLFCQILQIFSHDFWGGSTGRLRPRNWAISIRWVHKTIKPRELGMSGQINIWEVCWHCSLAGHEIWI